MTQYSSILTGIHPLSEALINGIFDLKYGRAVSSDHVIKAFERDIIDLIAILVKISPEAVSIGNLGWWDIFRPFTEGFQRLTTQGTLGNLPVTRIPLTNTFYRQPIISTKVSPKEPVLKTANHPFLEGNILQIKYLPTNLKRNAWSVCLPGPYTFSRASDIMSKSQKAYSSQNELMVDFSKILCGELTYLANEGFSHVVIDESYFTWDSLDNDTQPLLLELWNQLSVASSLRVIIHTHQFLSNEKLQLLLESKSWGIGIDCIRTDIQKLLDYDFNGKSIVAGVVDSQSYFRSVNGELLVEKVADLVQVGNDLAEAQVKNIVLSPTSRLEYIPRSVADLKLEKIGKAIKKLQNNEESQ
ncbi:MAG: hypothetical protein ACFE8U_00135 [Candidatus Hermodarchaeota archaeon]